MVWINACWGVTFSFDPAPIIACNGFGLFRGSALFFSFAVTETSDDKIKFRNKQQNNQIPRDNPAINPEINPAVSGRATNV